MRRTSTSEEREKETTSGTDGDGLYIVLVSVHGLVRGHSLELGRDADTGGQIKYVVELARALIEHPEVGRVDLITRQIFDPKVSPDYSEPMEPLAPGANIVRLPAGPRRYFRKEVLWPYLDGMVDEALQYFRRVGRVPDVVHSHYADAGHVGTRLTQLLGVPLIHTGHSLGVEKRRRLLDKGLSTDAIESQLNMAQRIEAEEITLGNAALVVASTSQEVEEQYSHYDNYHPKRMRVIPPGLDVERFHPSARGQKDPPYAAQIDRFLDHPSKPLVLALSRADERKNIATLVRAFGENPDLRAAANLLIIAGNRDDLRALDKGARTVLQDLLCLIDRYDLYGQVAYPKHHEANDVPDIYRIAARRRGVFVNPALTEPFGLTLIEAAASGLPLVATNDGGPTEIIRRCRNGLLIDPLDADEMGEAIFSAVSNRAQWGRWSKAGVKGVQQHYTWRGHVNKYVKEVQGVLGKARRGRSPFALSRSRMPTVDRLLICDLDNTLLGDHNALVQLQERLAPVSGKVGFGIATGRSLGRTLAVLKEWGVPTPDLLITSVGSEIYYGNTLREDSGWQRHINHAWKPEALRQVMAELPGLKLQPESEQGRFKLSYYFDPQKAPSLRDIRTQLRHLDLHCKYIYSFNAYLDLLPVRASKGLAIRYLMMRWGLDPDHVLVAGDSGNDTEMLRGETLGVVVGNHSHELARLRGEPRIYFAGGHHAWGIIEGIDHYDFLRRLRTHDEDGGFEP